jgi:zinc transport system substrate-binding protein
VLNPLEGLTRKELNRGDDYFSVMERNKENLAKALGAK